MGKFLGIDYGSSRVGLALAESEVKLASPYQTVAPADLAAAIKAAGPFEVVVVGLPRSLDGRDTPQTLAVRRFCDDVLWRQLHIDPVYQDEAGTSSIAEEHLKAAGKPYSKGDIDAGAAALILQDYLDSL
ncbi:MAG: Holliday junction resolvase RuvX [Candidatus Saccharimonadales bacterium]